MAVGFSRKTMRDHIARAFDLFEGTATGGSTTTVVDSTLTRYADDYFIGANVYWYDTNADYLAWCTDFVAASGILTVSPAFALAASAGIAYQCFFHVAKAAIDRAINQACIGAQVLTRLVPSATSLDYCLTGAKGLWRMGQMLEVWVRDDNDLKAMPHRLSYTHYEDGEGELWLRLPYLLSADDGLWVIYQLGENMVPTDATLINLPLALVKARAMTLLLQDLVAHQDQGGVDRWGTLLRYWEEQKKVEEAMAFNRPAGKVFKHAWGRDFPDSRVSRGEKSLGLVENYGGDFANYP